MEQQRQPSTARSNDIGRSARLQAVTCDSRVTDAIATSAFLMQNPAALVRASRLRVMLVDDCPVQQLLTCALLARWNILPQIACDGLEAVLLSGEQDFDIILMDVEMPVMDGMTATARIRQGERRARRERPVPVVAYTTGNLAADEARWRTCGMNGVLNKPCDALEMSECLERWCPSGFAASKHQRLVAARQHLHGTEHA